MSSNPSPTRRKVAAQAGLRRARPTTARSQPFGVFGSLLFHGLILAAALFGFHRNFDVADESHVVPVDLVTIADKTNVAAMAPPTPPAPQPQKLDIPTPPVPQPPEPQMQDVEPAPEPPIPKFDVQKEKKPDTDKPVEKKDAAQDFNALLNKLTAPDKTVKNAKAGPRVVQAVGLGNAMTADISDALKSQIYRCWSPPTGAPDARDLIVDYDLSLNPDGTVGRLQMTMGTAAAAAGNAYTRAAAEAASRAIYQCAPYRLPADRYAQWREFNPLRFDPRQMMEQ
jgi:hypothetical protein